MLKKLLALTALLFTVAGVFGQAQKLVLFEEFTSENCPNCGTTNPYVQARISQNPNYLVCIRYQCYIPSGGPLYYQDKNDVDNRMAYYGVNSAPWGQQDGALWDSTPANIYNNDPYGWATDTTYLDTEYARPSPFTINITHSFTGATDSFYATVVITGADSFTASLPGKLTLRVAMVEDLQFTIAPGDNGETAFPDVVRHMYPGATGTTLTDSWHSGQTQTFNFSGPVPSIIKDKTKVHFVAFIQDDNSLHVMQAGQSQPFIFALDAIARNVQTNFIRCSGSFTPVFTLDNNGTSDISTCSFQIAVDGAGVSTQGWAGTLPGGDSAIVRLFPVSLSQGAHSIAIIAQNPDSSVDGNMGNDTAAVTVGVTTVVATPVVQGFETADNPGWLSESVSNLPYGWSRQSVGHNSNYSYQMDLWDVPAGDISNLYVPEFALTGFTNAAIKFDLAYCQYDFGNNNSGLTGYSKDSLYIQVSTDCGTTWQTVYTNGGSSMKTAPEDSLAPFTPSESQWVTDSADLTAFAGNADVLMRFKALSGNGNELYIDNVNIYGFNATGIEPLNNLNTLVLYPNPANNYLTLRLKTSNPITASYRIINMAGQTLLTGKAEQENFIINTAMMPDGLYLLEVASGDEQMLQVFGVAH